MNSGSASSLAAATVSRFLALRAHGANLTFRAQQPIVLALDDCVAFARPLFESGTVERHKVATCGVDQPIIPLAARGLCDTLAANPQHFGDALVRNHHAARLLAIKTHQYQLAQPLFQGMMPDAYRRLCDLRDQYLGVVQQ